jgi:hypothetical protein
MMCYSGHVDARHRVGVYTGSPWCLCPALGVVKDYCGACLRARVCVCMCGRARLVPLRVGQKGGLAPGRVHACSNCRLLPAPHMILSATGSRKAPNVVTISN